MPTEIHVGDIGTVFEVTIQDDGVAVNISSATTKEIIFRKPDKTLLTKAANFSTDGTDGKIRSTTVSGDLNAAGVWSIQAHVILPGGDWKSSISEFSVIPNL